MNILENINEIENKIENNLNLNNLQDKFLNSTIGQIANTAINLGLKTMLPDLIEDEVIEVKDALITGGIKEGISTAIDNAIAVGKKVLGIDNTAFTSVSQVEDAINNGNLINEISKGIDNVLDNLSNNNFISESITSIIKGGKNVILNNIGSNVETEFQDEINAINKIEKYISNWEKAYDKKDIDGVTKEYNKIEKQMKKILPLENIINNVNKIRNINQLISNNENFDFNKVYLDLANNI